MEKSQNNLIVIGDPIIDCYIKTNNSNTARVYDQRGGGALNVFQNAQVLHGYYTYFQPSEDNLVANRFNLLQCRNEDNIHTPAYYFILRIDDQEDIPLCADKNKKTFYKWHLNQRTYTFLKYSTHLESSALILSDYNKGVLNRTGDLITSVNEKFKFAVIDTRYRSLNLSYLKLSKINIWRCTGQEYDEDFARNFDYIVWTNAEAPVRILNKYQKCIATIKFDPIQESKIKDTCGAGDTFTASFATALNVMNKEINLDQIIKACNFSLECCQEVIQSKGTSITTKNIRSIVT